MARGRPKAVEHEGRGHVYERELRATTTDGVPLLLRELPPRVMSCCWTTASTLSVSCRRRRGATTSSVRTASRVSVWRVSRGGRLRRGELI